MKARYLAPFALLAGICAILISGPAKAEVPDTTKPQDVKTQDIKLDSPEFQALIDQLFGTTSSTGLLQGTQRFDLQVRNLALTSAQADMFFTASTTSTQDISDLIAKAEAIKGSEVNISGSIDGKPFDLRMEGKQVKADGLVLTQAEFDALIAQLQATTGLHEAKIEATVDGQLKIAKLENVPGKVKIENRDLHGKDAPHVEHHSEKGNSDVRSSFTDKSSHDARPEKIDKIDRPEKVEKIERPEKIERVERPDKTERIERPDVAQGGGKGRG
ncbi:MAG TPA: hypothetical protein VFO86_08075 [Terriglobia bacterium]|nr:hypothetical protein [Terriglobia bacterium]